MRERIAVWSGLAVTGAVVAAAAARLPELARHLDIGGLATASPAEFAGHWLAAAAAALAGIALAAWCAGAGEAGRRWLRTGADRCGLERLAVRLLIGAGLGATAILGFGLAGLLYPPLLWAAGAAFAGSWVVRHGWPAPPSFGGVLAPSPTRWVRVLLFAGLVVLGLHALAPQIWTDPLAYHLAAPQRFQALHRETAGGNFCFRFPLLPEQLMLVAPGLLPPFAFILVSVATLLALVHGWVRRRWGATAADLAALAVIASSPGGFDAVQPKPDFLAGAFAVLAVAGWLPGRNGRQSGGGMLLAGASVAWALCAKYPAAVPAAGLAVWQLAVRRDPRALAPAAAGCLLAFAPFALRGWLVSGNPVYPFILGGLRWDPASAALFDFRGCPGADFNPWWVGVFRAATTCAPLAAVGLPWLAIARSRRGSAGHPAAGLVVVAAASCAAWCTMRPCVRYMLPAFLLLSVLGAVGVARLAAEGGRWPLRAAGAVLGAGLVHALIAADADGPNAWRRLAAGAGLESRESFLARTWTTYGRAARRIADLRRHSSGDLLLVGDTRVFAFGRSGRAIGQDTSDVPLPLRLAREAQTPEALARKIRQEGIGVIVVNYLGMEYAGALYRDFFPWTTAEVARWAACWGRRGEWLDPGADYDELNGGFAVFRIRSTPRETPGDLPFLPGAEGHAARWPGESDQTHERRLRALTAAAPDISLFRTRLGAALVRRGEWEAARVELERGLRSGFDAEGIRRNLARALDGLGRPAGAATQRRRADALRDARARR